jgi:hypothetical protein
VPKTQEGKDRLRSTLEVLDQVQSGRVKIPEVLEPNWDAWKIVHLLLGSFLWAN